MVFAAMAALPAGAQIANERAGAGIYFERYGFGESAAIGIESIALLTLPFAARLDVSSGIALQLSGAWARAALSDAAGRESTLAGFTDTELRATFAVPGQIVTLTAIALLPTGHSQLTEDEAEVAGVVAADVLPFRMTNWGTGGGFGASIAAAAPLGGFAAGISAGYVVAREFEPLDADQDFVYRPGDQLHITAALDRDVTSSAKASLRLSFQRYATDEAEGANLYQAGNRYQATGSYAFAAGTRASAIVYAGFLHRGEGQFEVQADVRPAQNQFLTGAGLRFPMGRGILQPALDLRVLTGTDDADSGYTAGIGVSGEWPLGGAIFVPTLRARLGNARGRSDAESSFTGADAGVAIRFGAR
jgi:hypothetical protein